jgi:hypothetical protein
LFSNTVADTIQYDEAGGAVSKPIVRTQYYSNGTFINFQDIESRNMEFSNENKRYQVYSFMPPAKKIDFTLNNFGQVYSTGSGDARASILKKNLIVKAWTGYELTIAESQSSQADDFTSTNKFVHTQKTGSVIEYDSSSYSGTVDSNLISNLYDSTTYDATFYDYSGYYVKNFTLSNQEKEFKQVSITTSSNKFDTRYRVSGTSSFIGSAWSTATSLSTGANVVQFEADHSDDHLQVAVLFKNENFDTADNISAISVLAEDNQYMFPQGQFVLDEPIFKDTKVVCKGRDYIKKALETEINLPDYTTSTNIATGLTDVFDRCSIPYDTANWDTTSTTFSVSATLHEELNNISGWKMADYLMDAINAGDDDWILNSDEDGSLNLVKSPTGTEPDFNIHYFYNIESIDKNSDSDKQLQRVTMLNKSLVVNKEALLKSYSGTGTDIQLTYATAIYVRYTDDNGAITTEDARTNQSIDFTCSGSTADIKVYGCTPKNAITDEVWAERGNAENVINNNGSTYRRVNPLFDQTMCDDFVNYLIGFYGDPYNKITLTMNPNPYLELNDKCLVFDLYTYTDKVYGITAIKETFNDPAVKQNITLQDRGFDLGAFIWDKNGYKAGINDLKYDNGFVWDQNLKIGSSDSTDYSYLKSINMR